MPRLADGLATRTHGVRPSEKTAFRVSPGFSPRGHLPWTVHPVEGRAPHARKEGIAPPQRSRPFGHRLIVNVPVRMECLGLQTASPRGRTECVPPRKPPSALAPGFPREAISPWTVHPWRGRALHARNIINARRPPNHNWHEGLSLFSSPGRVGKKRGRRFAVRNSPIPQ